MPTLDERIDQMKEGAHARRNGVPRGAMDNDPTWTGTSWRRGWDQEDSMICRQDAGIDRGLSPAAE